MSGITYKIEWSLFLDGEEREHSTDEYKIPEDKDKE